MFYLMTLKLPRTMLRITLFINNRFEVSSLPPCQKESEFRFLWFESHLQHPNWYRPAF